MEHLKWPADPVVPIPKIPWHNKYAYDNASTFTDFPTRCGISKAEFWHGDFSAVPAEDHDSFFQAWLFFGVLHYMLGAEMEEFVDRETGSVTTARLVPWMQRWGRRQKGLGEHALLEEQRRVRACLKEMCDMISLLDAISPDGTPLSSISEEVAVSIIVLGGTLSLTQKTSFGGAKVSDDSSGGRGLGWPISRYERSRLAEAGCCESMLGRLRNRTLTGGILFCTAMQRVDRVEDHSRCTTLNCVADSIDESTYQTAHTPDCGGCEPSASLVPDVCRVLEDDSFPIIALTKTKKSWTCEISVVPFTDGLRYTAMSHVWADGLGNVNGNTLPQCQLSRLHGLLVSLKQHVNIWKGESWAKIGLKLGFPVDEMRKDTLSKTKTVFSQFTNQETVYVWMDTLCIPMEKRLRKVAITRMADVYEKADRVLVLDSTLFNIPATRSKLELSFRILAAPWMRRAWTLQEARLASNLYLQFSGRPYHVFELWHEHFDRYCRMQYDYTTKDLLRGLVVLLPNWGAGATHTVQESYPSIHGELVIRTTSHIEDKLICLALLLRLNMAKIMANDGDARTVEVYRQLPYLSERFLWHDLPTVNIPGFRWACKNLMAAGFSPRATSPTLTDQGLFLKAPGFLAIGRSDLIKDPSVFLCDSAITKIRSITWRKKIASAPLEKALQNESVEIGILLKPRNMYTPYESADGVVIILNRDPENPTHNTPERSGVLAGHFLGWANIRGLGDAQSVEAARRLRGLKGTPLGDEAWEDVAQGLDSDDTRGRGFLEAEERPATQEWCILTDA